MKKSILVIGAALSLVLAGCNRGGTSDQYGTGGGTGSSSNSTSGGNSGGAANSSGGANGGAGNTRTGNP
jgi:hypothetical protein